MVTDLYNKVVELIGVVPIELDWLYPIGTLFMLGVILLAFLTPFLIMYYFVRR